ncbi:hypothetical protein ABZ897_39205 [Nonomuraea sp. NPDC046802]|uniref:hypothetical protein n=1 Tax=Nonomuraea sp. NPDC046802 TaxID=3154919 RepID=UPI0034028147
MRLLIAVLASVASAAALPLTTADLAEATGPAPTITTLDCALGTGSVVPNATSSTRLTCYGGTFHGRSVAAA